MKKMLVSSLMIALVLSSGCKKKDDIEAMPAKQSEVTASSSNVIRHIMPSG